MGKSDASRNVDAMFEPVKTGELGDLELLPRRFELFVGEVRREFEQLTNRIVPVLSRLENALQDIKDHQTELERRVRALEGAPCPDRES